MNPVRVNLSELIDLLGRNASLIDPEKLESDWVVNTLSEKWSSIVGEIFYYHTRPYKYLRGKLLIFASHPSYKMEISMIKDFMLNTIQEIIGTRVIKIEVLVKPFKPLPELPKKRIGNLENKEYLLNLLDGVDESIKTKMIELIRIL
ncbi:MAG: DUF721 domain-containing protein [Leptospiraceae bacterium]|nr:DUF721 domain-containing protein [Leptospiraceae bacterium]